MNSEKWTKGLWRAVPLGGSSTVIVRARPARNDTSIPPYGYDEALGHCIAYPFNEDDGRVRQDFVCFSHDDAMLIAAAPALYEALKEACEVIKDLSRYANNNGAMIDDETFAKGLAAVAQARGEPQ